jgi:hypothetical protein
MKNCILFTFILFVTGIFAQTPPQGFNYSSVIRADNNQAIPNKHVSVRLSIVFDNPNGSIVYQEIHSDTTNQFGVLNLTVGKGVPTIGDFSNIAWENGNHYLQTELDQNAGSNFEIMGIAQFLSVPYALVSGNSMDSPTQLSDLNNDVGYVTNSDDADSDPANELQVLSISNDTIFLSNGGFAKLPPAYSGTNTDNQILSYQNDTLSISNGNSIAVPALSNDETLANKITSGTVIFHNVSDGWMPVPYINSNDTLQITIDVNDNDEVFMVYGGYTLEYTGSSASSKSAVWVHNSTGYKVQGSVIDVEHHSNGQMVTSCAGTAVFTGLSPGEYTFRVMNYTDASNPPGSKYFLGSRHIVLRRL